VVVLKDRSMTMIEKEWEDRFIKRMIELGLDKNTAYRIFQAGFYDLADDPEQAAEDEASYWQEDT